MVRTVAAWTTARTTPSRTSSSSRPTWTPGGASTQRPSAGSSTTTASTYAGIRTADGTGEVGGLNTHGTPGPGGALLLVISEDLDASLAGVEAAGGRVVEPPEGYPGGRRFTFADPFGNVLGVYQPS